MKRQRKILLIAVSSGCALVAFTIWMALPRNNGPRVHGRSLYSWLQNFRNAEGIDSPRPSEATAAVQELGTNAIPYLLQWLKYQDPRWADNIRVTVASGVRHVSPALSEKILGESFGSVPSRRAWIAIYGFRILGSQAKPAVPELERMVKGPIPEYQLNALTALGEIGPDGLPTLLSVVTNKASPLRIAALANLQRLGTNAAPAVPAIVSCMQDPNSRIATWATFVLGATRAAPEISVPALVAALSDRRSFIRKQATHALREIAPELLRGTNAAPMLK